jgi:hypothetical protein
VRNKKGEIVNGRYPIASRQDVENAVADHARSGGGAEERAHIITNAKALGATDALPDDWKTSESDSDGPDVVVDEASKKAKPAKESDKKPKPKVRAKVKGKKQPARVRESL